FWPGIAPEVFCAAAGREDALPLPPPELTAIATTTTTAAAASTPPTIVRRRLRCAAAACARSAATRSALAASRRCLLVGCDSVLISSPWCCMSCQGRVSSRPRPTMCIVGSGARLDTECGEGCHQPQRADDEGGPRQALRRAAATAVGLRRRRGARARDGHDR